MGLTLGKEAEISREIYTLVGIDQEFEIPPHASDYQVESNLRWLPEDAQLLAIMPHMHLRGKSFRLIGKRVAFDNSASNPSNPDPEVHVTWGDQTWEEMAVAFFEVSEPRPDDLADQDETTEPSEAENETTVDTEIPPDTRRKMAAEADRLLARFDKNGDGRVGRYETPLAFRRFSFREIDTDGDKLLTRDEMEQAARRRVE